MPASRRDSVAFTVVVTVLVVLGALAMLLVFLAAGASRVTLLAVVLAAVPVGPLLAVFLWLDRYEPEPKRLLVAGLLWGGCGGSVVARNVDVRDLGQSGRL